MDIKINTLMFWSYSKLLLNACQTKKPLPGINYCWWKAVIYRSRGWQQVKSRTALDWNLKQNPALLRETGVVSCVAIWVGKTTPLPWTTVIASNLLERGMDSWQWRQVVRMRWTSGFLPVVGRPVDGPSDGSSFRVAAAFKYCSFENDLAPIKSQNKLSGALHVL